MRRHEAAPVGVTGFEPATLCSQSRCATKLRYTPKDSCPMHHHTGADAKCRARGRLTLGSSVSPSGVRGCSSMVEPLPSKQITRVRFPSSAPALGKPRASWPGAFLCSHPTLLLTWGGDCFSLAMRHTEASHTWHTRLRQPPIAPMHPSPTCTQLDHKHNPPVGS